MADSLSVRESIVEAETRVEAILDGVLTRIAYLNSQLVTLHDAIKSAQPVATGTVCLEMYPCGRGCLGCPHPRWVKYWWTDEGENKPGKLRATNLDSLKKDPILALARGESYYPQVASLIRETKSILEERAKLLASIKSLRYAAKLTGNSAYEE